MSFRNSVYIVASPRPRAGKTLLSRLLIDFHSHEGRAARGFDLNIGDNTLAQYLPAEAETSDVSTVQGQMALFDRLVDEDGSGKVVDVGGDAFKAFFAIAERIGFADEARKREIAPVILFIMSPDRAASDAYWDLRTRFPRAVVTKVQNDMLAPALNRDRAETAQAEAAVRLPVLAPGLRKYIEAPPFSFADGKLANARNISIEAHIEMQRWLRKTYVEFRELDLRVLLSDVQSALRL